MLKQIKAKLMQQKQNLVDQEQFPLKHIPVSQNLNRNKQVIKETMGNSEDIFMRDLNITLNEGEECAALLVGIGNLVEERAVNEEIVKPLLSAPIEINQLTTEDIKAMLYVQEVEEEANLYECILQMLKGSTLLLVNGFSVGLIITTENLIQRAIEEPPTGNVVSGARDGFIEEIETNIGLLRKRIAHPSLRLKSYILGEYSQTRVVVAYVNGIADEEVFNLIQQRIKEIEVDDISSSGQIEQYITESAYSIFSTTGNTERPDKLAAMLMEGRAAVLVDGSPVALYYPSLFVENLHSVEDYSSKPFYSSFTRILRVIAFILSIFLPALYICAVNLHKGLIPSGFLLALEESREGVPFPLVQETIMLIILFEIVREAGIRMPRAIGQAVSIVGALILGEVSVAAGLISAQTIIVVATASITSFIVTPLAEVVALLRIAYIIPSAIFGFYGLMICFLITITHMVNLTSMGVYYMGPLMPVYIRDWKDTLIRLPYNLLTYRQKSIPNLRPIRFKKVPVTDKKKDDIE